MTNQAAQTMPGLHGLSDAADYLARNPSDEYAQRRFRERMEQVRAALSQTAGVPEPLPMDTAPRDGTMVRLLVNFTDHATEDTAGPAWTIGAYPSDDESGGWQFAGWCWTHDHFTEGEGTPIGWLPMLSAAPAASGGEKNNGVTQPDGSGFRHGDNSVGALPGALPKPQVANPADTTYPNPPSAASVGGVHPDALQDGTRSKSTAKRIEALAASGGGISHVTIDFPQVGTAGPFKVIDGRMTLPDVTMNDLIHHARMGYVPASNYPAAAAVSERARHIEVLHAIGSAFDGIPEPCEEREAIKAAVAAIEQALTQQRGHGTTGSAEKAEKSTFVPCDCGCGRSCCAMCGNDVGFLSPQPSADAVRELVKRILNWQPLTSINKADRLYQILIAAGIPFESVTDELESLLSGGSHA